MKHLRIPTAAEVLEQSLPLPLGVQLLALRTFSDDRGAFTELFRDEWAIQPRPVQWNIVHSKANVLRGVHVHHRHGDALTAIAGELVLGLRDLRKTSPTYGLTSMFRLIGTSLHLACIPVGVAHGFYFPEPATHVYGVSKAFDGSDEFGCQWDDPALELDWPCDAPTISQRDRDAGSLRELMNTLALAERT